LPVIAKKVGVPVHSFISSLLRRRWLIYLFHRRQVFIIDPNARSWYCLASILSMPYAMLSGAFTGLKNGILHFVSFNFFVVIPQIVAATILGFIVNNFSNEPIYAVLIEYP
jgi:maltose/moltooligosaccharide transporter